MVIINKIKTTMLRIPTYNEFVNEAKTVSKNDIKNNRDRIESLINTGYNKMLVTDNTILFCLDAERNNEKIDYNFQGGGFGVKGVPTVYSNDPDGFATKAKFSTRETDLYTQKRLGYKYYHYCTK